jgi:diguanylate cyclase (GGDEF)-like protein
MLLLRRTDDFTPLAVLGAWHSEWATDSLLKQVCAVGIAARGPMRHASGYVTAPIASTHPARCVLLLRFGPQHQLHSLTFPVLTEMASVAAPYLDARWRDAVLHQLLDLNRASEDTSSAEMYRRVLQTALQLVPGADSGTLLTRTSPNEPFQYQAAEGFDLAALRRQPLTESQARAWYGADDEGWLQGLPRILSSDEVNIGRLGASTTPNVDPEATSYHLIKSTLCLPVLRDGHVMAVLDLDNQKQAHGLGRDSSQLAHLFGAPLASLLHRQHTRELLRRAAFTDDLTGLDNRRAFDQALERELARAKRGGPGPSVLLMDLKQFKAINDQYGHDVGDQVLKEVAAALRGALREVDYAARRGGDEFVALLVDTPAAAAAQVKERVAQAVAAVDAGLGPMVINIGAASYDVDGADPVHLMRVADERMYHEKRL